ncbi:bifunctional 4-hydroxy-2-oxoglutarate aldolase/2-dehydro-3-deoxy-phosphogluconate aldolase [Aeromonas allosaccharophila]|uniref:bifunctional 4-hydroxy-2-oxoglutarate aldolase/2-dehydro-3-deoxy-phosphogluconate aldolase n=1 Tax=Aeromonas allosaccharophila TaxID=656 RepID=UPI0012E0609D|nr:bifunctional 4-hydroxy-2-oxoglutarate aldolase/2-dehydro-3-deoxy-phosphogluconate aldolase [Aeromonas allosaccharophila]
MMSRWLEQLGKLKVVPVIQIDKAMDAAMLGKTLVENGLPAAEITFRTPAAAEAIRQIKTTIPDIILCAGTVLTREQADQAISAGADFVISPGLNPNIVKYCQDAGIGIIPGVNNPSQIEQGLELGLQLLKFFPAEASGGVAMLKSLAGPYPHVRFMPTGGINLSNLLSYLALPQVLACGGTWIATPPAINGHDWNSIGRNVKDTISFIAKGTV